MNRNSSTWTSAEIDAIESALSSERLSRYLSATSAKSDALKTYAWNTAISAAFYGPFSAWRSRSETPFTDALSPNTAQIGTRTASF